MPGSFAAQEPPTPFPECRRRQDGQPPSSEGTGQGILAGGPSVSPEEWKPPKRRQDPPPHLTSPEGPLNQRLEKGATHQAVGTCRAN